LGTEISVSTVGVKDFFRLPAVLVAIVLLSILVACRICFSTRSPSLFTVNNVIGTSHIAYQYIYLLCFALHQTAGVIGKKIKEIRLMREKLIENNTNEPKKSKTKIEKEDDIPKRVAGEGSFKKSSNVKKESKDGIPKRVAGEGSFKKSSNAKKKNKDDVPKITTDEIIELSSDEEGDNNVIDIQKARRISLDGITIELSSDEEDGSNDADLQKARRISLEDPGSDLDIKKG
jgi:hypothetical protein